MTEDKNNNLPHQKNDIKADEINEIEQEPPEIIVDRNDYAHLSELEKNLPPSLLNPDEKLKEKIKKANILEKKDIYPELDVAAQKLIINTAKERNHIDLDIAIKLTGYTKKRTKALLKYLVKSKKLLIMGGFNHRSYRPR